jgi:hypothetical protein
VLQQFRDIIFLRKYLSRRVVSRVTLLSGEVWSHSNGWWQQPTSSDPQRSHSTCSTMAQSPSFLLQTIVILFISLLLISLVTPVINVSDKALWWKLTTNIRNFRCQWQDSGSSDTEWIKKFCWTYGLNVSDETHGGCLLVQAVGFTM